MKVGLFNRPPKMQFTNISSFYDTIKLVVKVYVLQKFSKLGIISIFISSKHQSKKYLFNLMYVLFSNSTIYIVKIQEYKASSNVIAFFVWLI